MLLNIKRSKLPECEHRSTLTSLYSTPTMNGDEELVLAINQTLLPLYGAVGNETATCCMRIVIRTNEDTATLGKCYNFNNAIKISLKIQHLYVNCSLNSRLIYENIHTVIVNSNKFKLRGNRTRISEKNSYNVLILGLNSISRLNFKRGLEKSFNEYINGRQEWFEMKGYNRVSCGNIFQNVHHHSEFI